MNMLITGGAGFIGSNAVEYFSSRGHRVVIIDNLLSGSMKNINHLVDDKKVIFHEADIRDRSACEKIFINHNIDTCINFAALISVAESTEKPLLTEEINVIGILNLLEICKKTGVKCFVHASSAAVYGDSEELPKKEDMALAPKSPYAITKLAGEYNNRFYGTSYGFNTINCRFFNVFGQRQNPASQYAAAVPIFISRAISGKDLTIFGDGEQTRDFIFVEDLVSAIEYMINLSEKKPGSYTVNLGYGNFISIKDLAGLIIDLSGSKSKIVFDDPRPGDIKYSYASVDRLRSLGWKESVGFNKGLAKAVEWYKNNSI